MLVWCGKGHFHLVTNVYHRQHTFFNSSRGIRALPDARERAGCGSVASPDGRVCDCLGPSLGAAATDWSIMDADVVKGEEIEFLNGKMMTRYIHMRESALLFSHVQLKMRHCFPPGRRFMCTMFRCIMCGL